MFHKFNKTFFKNDYTLSRGCYMHTVYHMFKQCLIVFENMVRRLGRISHYAFRKMLCNCEGHILCAYIYTVPTPPLGCAMLFFCFLFFVSCFFNLLVSWFLVSWFVVGFPAMAKRNQNPKKQETRKKMTRPSSLPLLSPLECAILFCFFVFFGFLVF